MCRMCTVLKKGDLQKFCLQKREFTVKIFCYKVYRLPKHYQYFCANCSLTSKNLVALHALSHSKEVYS